MTAPDDTISDDEAESASDTEADFDPDLASSDEYRVGSRFRVADALPGVGPDGEREPAADEAAVGAEWRVVATDDDERLVRFDEGEWYRLDEVERLVGEGSLEPLGAGDDAPPTVASAGRTYWLEPGLKFVADPDFARSHLSGTSEGPVEFVVVDVEDSDVRVAERTEEGYVATNRAMSRSTLERGTELADLDCVGPASVEERDAAVDAAS
ncbi:hypothetical protein ACFO0N_03150 [Halobium salinum]|uniref:Uncharacterized protein n=1 Tax=Halobium salinum TaxID=1364940 RepID=A0ABD5P7U8_9EURY|nr:hypothetical protein [Halobium salinum]